MKKGRFERPKKKRRAGKVILTILIVLLLLVAALAAAGIYYYNSMLNRMNHVEVPKIQYTEAPTEAAPTEGAETMETTEATTVPTETVHVSSPEDYVNILVIGQAFRAGEESHTADTMILVTLNKYEKTISTTSILRNTKVQQGGVYKGHTYGGGMINDMYNMGHTWGGAGDAMAVMNQILYDNFGIEVDHNIEVNFQTVVEFINLMGGVRIDLTEAEAEYLNGEYKNTRQKVEPGENLLWGGTALAYARMRKAAGDNDSDIIRTERQRKMVAAVLDRLKTRSLSKLQEIVNECLPYVTTSMTNEEITDMLLMVLPMITELEIVNSGTCPASYKGKEGDLYKNGQILSYLEFNVNETKKAMRAITEGEIAE